MDLLRPARSWPECERAFAGTLVASAAEGLQCGFATGAARGQTRRTHPPWEKIIKRAGLPEGTVPYALRHSSIVRMLRAGLPTRVVAQVHDTSTAMLEKHYSGAISDMMEDVIASAIVPLLPTGGDKVVPLRAGQPVPVKQA